MDIETVILRNLLKNEDYSRKVLPFLDDTFFHNESEKNVFIKTRNFIMAHNTLPTAEAVKIDIDQDSKINEEQFKDAVEVVNVLENNIKPEPAMDWLLLKTEGFCKDMAIHNAIMDSISILDGDETQFKKEAIPDILSSALAISFDPDIGHDFLKDYQARYAYYHQKLNKVPFNIKKLNDITNGGLPKGTLTVLLGGIHVGKTLCLCHMAGGNLEDGKNVLYITLEMGEEEIGQRVDAHLMDLTMDDVTRIQKNVYYQKAEKIKAKTNGRLIVRQFPNATAGRLKFMHLLNELALKQNFLPDIIYVDYLNLCVSDRIKPGSNFNSYNYVKAIAEELRGLAVETKVPLVTATQVNRDGFNSTDMDMTDTSESFGVPMTADLMLAIISSDDLKQLGQYKVRQLKNRLGDISKDTVFHIGVNTQKQTLYNLDMSQQHVTTDVKDNLKKFTTFDFGDDDETF